MSEVPRITPRMITDELLWRLKLSTQRSQELHEALLAATTEELKRAVRERFMNYAKTDYLCQTK